MSVKEARKFLGQDHESMTDEGVAELARAGEAVIRYGTGASSKGRTVGRPRSKNAWSKVAPKFTIS